MIITLYLNDKLIKFQLPSQVSGSYSFDFEGTEAKLINVEARNGKWVLYSTRTSSIVSSNVALETTELLPNNFYFLKKNNKNYTIYVDEVKTSNLLPYKYDKNLNIIIGNDNNANIRYASPYLNGLNIKISYVQEQLVLEKTDKTLVYINDNVLVPNKTILSMGDKIEIFGLKIMIFNEMVLINNVPNKLDINTSLSGLINYQFPQNDVPKDIDINDRDLYTKDDYYSKSPRLRRLIEPKKIKITAPPSNDNQEETPFILTIGTMMTMGMMSSVMLLSTILSLKKGKATIEDSWPQLAMAIAMLTAMVLWPTITQIYNRTHKKKKKKRLEKKYTYYLNDKKEELKEEQKTQGIILNENLISIEDCLNIISHKQLNFWDKRNDQNDFLTVRVGMGNERLAVDIDYSEEDFSIDDSNLKKKVKDLIEEFKYVNNVPIGYSFYENKATAIMGKENKPIVFMNNLILQLLTFYSYDDLKFVVFTNNKNNKNWEYLKYLNHTFSNDRQIRFYSTNQENAKNVADFLHNEINERLEAKKEDKNKGNLYSPHYFIIVDGYENVKRYDFVKTLTENDDDLGMNIVFIENKLSKLPSKCNNFIILGDTRSEIMKNSYEKQEKIEFRDELHYNLDMFKLTKDLSNVPIEFAEGISELPDSITFLEMEKVGKVEQLNILNRWNQNDSTQSLKAEVGVDDRGDLMYLDLHERFHGPHGLIAGMTGSGKSEFIITYILSMAINYSPDDVAFILIDYKGGGLAFAFENKTNGIVLPHLAGTITNLDKAEMDRTLVSIDSEIKRRQEKFNEARDLLGQSTIDIYKYQRYYKEGKLKEPIPHLFIICDEFAELKSQQPDFMDNLISVARIGRSLGVHLILATQKPSGVVNDQIWSNTKFRVCLKVQDASDSKEMLKRPEAASLKQAGRFYLQVGYDEYFALGQSGWCGAKYYPSDKIVKQVDKSINFIDDSGNFIKSVQESTGPKIQAQGEQLAAIMNNIIEVSKLVNKKARRLWLDNVPAIVLVDALRKKYDVKNYRFNPTAIIGEYDAPELQQQGIIIHDFLKDGNTVIYGVDGTEKENLLKSIIYSSCEVHSSDEINFYVIDYGSETLRIFNKLPQMGGMVFASDDEKYNNLIKLIKDEIKKRKKLFADFGGEYKSYIKSSGKTLPIKVVIINNYDSLYEAKPALYEELPELVRDSERYGILFILTANASNSVNNKVIQNFKTMYGLRLKDSSEYSAIFNARTKMEPRDIQGRGLFKSDAIHEFQTASIIEDDTKLNEYLTEFIKKVKEINTSLATNIPVLPEIVRLDNVKEKLTGLNSIPIGMTREDLEINTINLQENIGTIISSGKLPNTENFVKSLSMEFKQLNTNLIVIDPVKTLNLDNKNYYTDNFDEVLDNLTNFIQKQIDSKSTNECVILINGVSNFITKLTDKMKLDAFFDLIKKYEKISVIGVDAASKLKDFSFEPWYTKIFSPTYGLWVGKGVSDQNIFRLSNISKEMTLDIKNDQGYIIQDGQAQLVKFIDFITEGDKNEE